MCVAWDSLDLSVPTWHVRAYGLGQRLGDPSHAQKGGFRRIYGNQRKDLRQECREDRRSIAELWVSTQDECLEENCSTLLAHGCPGIHKFPYLQLVVYESWVTDVNAEVHNPEVEITHFGFIGFIKMRCLEAFGLTKIRRRGAYAAIEDASLINGSVFWSIE